MFPLQDSWTIVILGSWNPSIFSPDWVAERLSETPDCKVETAFNLADPTAPRKITFDGITLYPGRKQLVINPLKPDVSEMVKCANVAIKIFSVLPHTPVGNVGINFSFFAVEKPLDILAASDEMSDSFSSIESSISRSLKTNDSDDYLLKHKLEQIEKGLKLSFNFHYELSDLNLYTEIFGKEIILKHYNEAVEFAEKYYELKITDIEQEIQE